MRMLQMSVIPSGLASQSYRFMKLCYALQPIFKDSGELITLICVVLVSS